MTEREPGGSGATILYAEPSRPSAELVAALRGAGHSVVEVESGARAIELALHQEPDLLLLDVELPDMGGAEVCQRLRRDPRTESLGILHITDQDTELQALATGLERGADGYLTRPVEPRELRAQVDALLRVRRAEKRARSLALEWQSTFDAITDLIFVLSREGEVLNCNRAATRQARRSRDEIVGRHYSEVFGAIDGFQSLARQPQLGVLEGPYSTELSLGVRWYRLAADPIRGNERPAEGDAVLVLTDITEIKLLEEEQRRQTEQLQMHNRRQVEFLALLAHELRNPLAAISAAHETLADAGAGELSDHAATALQVVGRQGHNLTRMVADLLDVSRITEGKVELTRTTSDLSTCVRHAIEAARPAVRAKGHSLRLSLPDEPVTVHVDEARIEQVVANLLDNAVKYTDEGGRIEVDVATEHDTAFLRVRDTGAGMPPERLGEAFDLFVQYERTLDRSQGGLGLGLTLVKRIVELHGGQVGVASDGPDRGSCFTVELPVWRGDAQPAPERSRAPGEHAPVKGRVLLVEDNEDLRALTAFKLRKDGFDVHEAADGEQGRRMALEQPFDAIVLDVGLPKLQGYDLAAELRRAERTRDVHLIAHTGYGSRQDRARAREAGFDDHLVKPASARQLRDLLLRGRRQEEP